MLANWDDIKRAEKSRTSIFDGIPRSMPSLAYAAKVGSKASKVGFDWPDVDGAFPKIAEETDELLATIDDGDNDAIGDEELGDLLFAVVNVARHLRVDPNSRSAPRPTSSASDSKRVEALAAERSIDLRGADLVTLDALWDEVKSTER